MLGQRLLETEEGHLYPACSNDSALQRPTVQWWFSNNSPLALIQDGSGMTSSLSHALSSFQADSLT